MDLKTNRIIKNAGIGFFIFVILAVVLLSIGEFAYGKFLSFYFPKPFCLYCRHVLAGIVGVISFIEMLVFIFIRNKKISILDFVSAVLFSIITSWVIIWFAFMYDLVCYIDIIKTGLALFVVIETSWLIILHYGVKKYIQFYCIVVIPFWAMVIALVCDEKSRRIYKVLSFSLGFIISLSLVVFIILLDYCFFPRIHPPI